MWRAKSAWNGSGSRTSAGAGALLCPAATQCSAAGPVMITIDLRAGARYGLVQLSEEWAWTLNP